MLVLVGGEKVLDSIQMLSTIGRQETSASAQHCQLVGHRLDHRTMLLFTIQMLLGCNQLKLVVELQWMINEGEVLALQGAIISIII